MVINLLNGLHFNTTNLIYRIRQKLRFLFRSKSYFTRNVNSSDSEVTSYIEALPEILNDRKSVTKFRRKMAYREILEHLGYKEGKRYLARIESLVAKEKVTSLVELNRQNDMFGGPITFNYLGYGRVSPTTLRYISTALEISNHFTVSSKTSVIEIGCGYGGQAAILNRMFGIKEYCCFDLPPVLELVDAYLQGIQSDLAIKHGKLGETKETWDLAVSNYAFSELSHDLQFKYLSEVLSKCSSGFMIMNSGVTNKTGRSFGKMNLEEIREFLPLLEVIEENPLTGPDNYVIVWGKR